MMEISANDLNAPETIGLARLFAIGFRDDDYGAIVTELLARLERGNPEAAAVFDLGTILMEREAKSETSFPPPKTQPPDVGTLPAGG